MPNCNPVGFTYHGFRYVELSGDFETPPECADVSGVVIHSDMPQTGRFKCSDPLANRLWSNLTCGDWRPSRTSATRAWTFRCAP